MLEDVAVSNIYAENGLLPFSTHSSASQTSLAGINSDPTLSSIASGSTTMALSAEAEISLSNTDDSSLFTNSLPEGYEVFRGAVLRRNEFFSCTQGGLFGAPDPYPLPPGDDCFGNPNSIYAWAYTDVPGFESDIVKQTWQDDLIGDQPFAFNLDGDDALVLFGSTPQEIAYLSFTLYETMRYVGEETLARTIDGYISPSASIGPGLNQFSLKTTNADSAFDGRFALIVTASTETEQQIKQSLIDIGVSEGAINSYLFPKEFANAGVSDNPTALSLLLRLTHQNQVQKERADSYASGLTPFAIPINFNKFPVSSYGADQDQNPEVIVGDRGIAIQTIGNSWKKVDYEYTVTPNTVLKFDFASDAEGDFHGIGLDADNQISLNRLFKLFGNQEFGIDTYDNYGGIGVGLQSYEIPIGEFFTGDINYLTLVTDHDVESPSATSLFQNIRLKERVEEPVIKAAFIKGPGVEGDVTEEFRWEDLLDQGLLRENSVETDLGLVDTLELLEGNIIEAYTQAGYTLVDQYLEGNKEGVPSAEELTAKNHIDVEPCRGLGYCAFDSPDALYSTFVKLDTTAETLVAAESERNRIEINSPDDVIVLFGVDHSSIGDGTLASYISFASIFESQSVSSFSFTGAQAQGSADQYLPSDLSEHLFAVNIVPSNQFGDDTPFTVNIPFEDLISADNPLSLTINGRAFLDEITATAPNPANLIPARLLVFSRAT